MQRKIVLFELNEVPFKIVDQFCTWRPESTLARKMPSCNQYQTHTQEVSELSPWITWPSVHRGVNDERHTIQNFGQDLSEVDKDFPPLWDLLTKAGVSVGICGTLHTYPMPSDLSHYSFYLPDTFAAGSECFPNKLSVFQEFNLQMARGSGGNVSQSVPWRSALQVLANAPELGFKLQTLTDVAGQLLSERTQKWRKVRRRTFQSVLAFDIFMKQLQSTRPAFSSFFTNHVASSMHRFWASAFPDEYEKFGYEQDWVDTYCHEIDWTMGKADEMFTRLVRFADKNPDYQIWLTTSMGQAATEAIPLETQLYITDLTKFMAALGFSADQWSRRPAMMPQWNLFLSPGQETRFRERIGTLLINDEPVGFREREKGFFSIDMGQTNCHKGPQVALLGGQPISFDDLGVRPEEKEDKAGCNAYHIPQGCMLIYDPRNAAARPGRPDISTLEVAPAILKNYAVPVPEYMTGAVALASGS